MSILLSFDESAYNTSVRGLDMAIPYLEQAVDAFLNLSIGTLTEGEFGTLFNDPKGLVFDKITGGSLKIGDLVIKKDKAMDLLTLPNGYSEYLAKVEDAIGFLSGKRTPGNNVISSFQIKNWYELDEENKVSLKEDALEREKKYHQRWLCSDAGKKMHEFAKVVLDTYEKLGISAIVEHPQKPISEVIGNIIGNDYGTGCHTLRVDGLLRYDR